MNADAVARVLDEFRDAAARGVASRADFERLKGRFLGREKGLVPGLFAGVKDLPPEQRADFGARANAAKREIEAEIARLGDGLVRAETEARERAAAVDVTLPGRRPRTGAYHPLTIVRRRIEEIFLRMGYSIADGPEVENDFHNFEALNFPPEHPARDTQDTFFVDAPRNRRSCCGRTRRPCRSARCASTARRCGCWCPAASTARTRSTRRTRPSSTRSRRSSSTAGSRWPT